MQCLERVQRTPLRDRAKLTALLPGFTAVSFSEFGDLIWTIWTADELDDGDLFTYVERWSRDGKAHVTSGFAGPPPTEADRVQWWAGDSTGLPAFWLVRTHSAVEAVTLRLSDGGLHRLRMPAPGDARGIRYQAGPVVTKGSSVVEVKEARPPL